MTRRPPPQVIDRQTKARANRIAAAARDIAARDPKRADLHRDAWSRVHAKFVSQGASMQKRELARLTMLHGLVSGKTPEECEADAMAHLSTGEW